MRKVTVQEWAEALLSGNYVQTAKVLQGLDDNQNCCLGVLCREAGMYFSPAMDAFVSDEYSDQYFPNTEVTGILSLIISDPDNLPRLFEVDYSSANDAGIDFETIAKVLLGELDPDVLDVSSVIHHEHLDEL